MKKREIKKLVLSAFTAVILLGGCGNAATTSDAGAKMEAPAFAENSATETATDSVYYAEEAYDMAAGGTEGTVSEQGESAQNTNRKLIRTVSLDVETQEYESLIARIKDRVKALGGYIENSNEYNGSSYYSGTSRNADLTLRIPADRVDEFLSDVAEESNITRQSENVSDVTLSYVDMESHRNVLRAEEERLTELLADTETIDEMIYIESRLSEIRYQIESMESQLRTYDNKVDYATVSISVTEVEVLTPVEPEQEPTTWQRLSEGFVNSLVNVGTGIRDFIVGLIIILPYLVVWGGVIYAIIMIVRGIIKSQDKKAKKRLEEQRKQWAEYQAGLQKMQAAQAQDGQKTSDTQTRAAAAEGKETIKMNGTDSKGAPGTEGASAQTADPLGEKKS